MLQQKSTAIKERINFSDKKVLPLPDLIELQKKSYAWFWAEGLHELFEEVSPITDFIGRDLEVHFGSYILDDPKFDEVTSKQKNITYEAPLRVNTTLTNNKTGHTVEQEVYLGDFPLITDRGTFIINGIERVIVSQLIRSAGVFFSSQLGNEGKLYGAKVIPNRGSWLEFETDNNGVIWVKIDRKRKVAATTLLRAFGYDNDESILALFKEIKDDSGLKQVEATLKKDTAKNEI